jgi:hypothetical protein
MAPATPGRLQYYKVDHEPFLPDDVKWAIRMCNRVVVREFALNYEEDVQRQILKYLEQNIKYDVMGGDRELNLDLTVKECEYLFSANDSVKAKAESGELALLHNKCAQLEEAVATGFLKVMDQLDRALQQITETEEEVYESLLDKGLDRIRSHHDNSVYDILTLNAGNKSIENLIIAQGSEHATSADVLKQLVGARAWIMMAKCHVTQEFHEKVSKSDLGVEADLKEYAMLRDSLVAAYAGDCSGVTGDAKIFKE